jgi:hypothetical protein
MFHAPLLLLSWARCQTGLLLQSFTIVSVLSPAPVLRLSLTTENTSEEGDFLSILSLVRTPLPLPPPPPTTQTIPIRSAGGENRLFRSL